MVTPRTSAHSEPWRIVSHGHASPEGFWYDQDRAEWVIVLKGSAELLFEHEGAPRLLWPGDYVHIPAHRRHQRTADGELQRHHGATFRRFRGIVRRHATRETLNVLRFTRLYVEKHRRAFVAWSG